LILKRKGGQLLPLNFSRRRKMMKRLTLVFALALAGACFVLPNVPAYAGNLKGCGPSEDKPKKCVAAVPEPGSFDLLAVGLAAIGGLAFVLRRKQPVQN
jgi:hypothetical protein